MPAITIFYFVVTKTSMQYNILIHIYIGECVCNLKRVFLEWGRGQG